MEWIANKPEDLNEIAAAFIKAIKGYDRIAFYGKMGVGKTTFIKAICKQLGVVDTISSPTFSLVNEYHSSSSVIYHFDFYRINSIEEVYDMGYEEYFYSNNLCLLEWPEKIEPLLDDEVVKVKLSENNGQRRIVLGLP